MSLTPNENAGPHIVSNMKAACQANLLPPRDWPSDVRVVYYELVPRIFESYGSGPHFCSYMNCCDAADLPCTEDEGWTEYCYGFQPE